MILLIIKFCELLLRISPRIINSLRSYIKHSKECLLLFPNTSKLVKKSRLRLVFPTYFSGVWKSEETLFLVFDLLLPTMVALLWFLSGVYCFVSLSISRTWKRFLTVVAFVGFCSGVRFLVILKTCCRCKCPIAMAAFVRPLTSMNSFMNFTTIRFFTVAAFERFLSNVFSFMAPTPFWRFKTHFAVHSVFLL